MVDEKHMSTIQKFELLGLGDKCYIATCVYGSYDAPQTVVLRRFRDSVLKQHFWGRLFIRAYYAISPVLVRLFGHQTWFHRFWRGVLDRFISFLKKREDYTATD